MALELRPNCECCNVDLPPAATDAMICSYECTFCRSCVDRVLLGVCPNCGGGFTPRPIRPATEWRPGLSLARRPASTERRTMGWTHDEVATFASSIRSIAPEHR